MHLLLLITHGAQAPGAALTLNRVALGAFFAISGYHKLFNASRHATLTRTLQDDGVLAVPIMQWLLPTVEFGGGCATRVEAGARDADDGGCWQCLGHRDFSAMVRCSLGVVRGCQGGPSESI
jgi:hypothetical protein